MASTTTRPTSRKGFALRKLVWVGPLTIIVAVLVNLAIRTIAVAFFGVPDGFTYLQAPFVIGSTVAIMLLAGLYPAPGMNLNIFWTMIVMHCASALLTVSLLTTLAVEP